jgi:hypothetical protein
MVISNRDEKNITNEIRPSIALNVCGRSQYQILQFVRMSEASSVVTGVMVCASGGSATVTKLLRGSGVDIMVPSSVFLPSLTVTLDVKHIGSRARFWARQLQAP